MKSKRGSVTVYICLFFMGLLSILTLFTGGVKQSVLNSSADCLGRLWGQSVLAEYDLNLYRRYHLFGFYGYPEEIKEKLRFYSEETGFPWEIKSCHLYAYSLRNTDVFRRQMIAAGKHVSSDSPFHPEQEVTPVFGHERKRGNYVFEHLPSEGTSRTLSLQKMTNQLKEGNGLKDILKTGSDTYFEFAYLFTYFKDKADSRELGDTYLQQEIEYIIGGKTGDKENEAMIKRRILAIREILNLFYLNQNPKTRNEALVAAELLTPGPAAVATQQTLLTLWALAESLNDYKLLIAGYSVQMLKSEDSWAVDLESAIADKEEGCIYTGVDKGENYQDYLRILLLAMDENVRSLRVMDLIQMNFRWLYYHQFRLDEYNGGVSFTYQINGREESVEIQYEKE